MATTAQDNAPLSNDLPSQPANSSDDDGLSRRPRDAHLIHLILQNLGITNYQSRVPLQLMDFAYRYTSSVLSDSLRLSAEGYSAAPGTATNRRGDVSDGSNITVSSLRQAIASRQDYQFSGPLPKEFLLEQAEIRNRHVLPKIERAWGVQLPDERFCLTGQAWSLKEEWESEGEDEDEEMAGVNGVGGARSETAKVAEANGGGGAGENVDMGGVDEGEDEDGGKFEDVFGDGADGDGDGDREMVEV